MSSKRVIIAQCYHLCVQYVYQFPYFLMAKLFPTWAFTNDIVSWVEICFPPSTGTLTTHSTETNHGGPSGNNTCLGHYWEPHKRATNLWTGQQ